MVPVKPESLFSAGRSEKKTVDGSTASESCSHAVGPSPAAHKHPVIPTGAGAPATAEWRDLLFRPFIGKAAIVPRL